MIFSMFNDVQVVCLISVDGFYDSVNWIEKLLVTGHQYNSG